MSDTYYPPFKLILQLDGDDGQRLSSGKLELPLVDGKVTGLNEAIAAVLDSTAHYLRTGEEKPNV